MPADRAWRIWRMITSGRGVVFVCGTVGLVTEYLITDAASGRSRIHHMAARDGRE